MGSAFWMSGQTETQQAGLSVSSQDEEEITASEGLAGCDGGKGEHVLSWLAGGLL